MKSTIDISKILAKKQTQKTQNFVNNIRFEYQIKTLKEFRQDEQTKTFLSCILQQYNKYNKLFYQAVFKQQSLQNVLNIQDYIYSEQYHLEKKPLPTAQNINVILFPVLPEVEKIIVEQERFKDVSLQYEQSQILNETVYTQKIQQPNYLNKLLTDENTQSAYTLTEMLSQFQKLVIKLLENRNKIIIYTSEDFKKYIQNIMYQLE